jgi:hypothetical protein
VLSLYYSFSDELFPLASDMKLMSDGLIFPFVKVHKKLGNTHLALMHFSWATDLDPKGANSQIKEAIDPAMSRSQAEEDTSTTHLGLLQ